MKKLVMIVIGIFVIGMFSFGFGIQRFLRRHLPECMGGIPTTTYVYSQQPSSNYSRINGDITEEAAVKQALKESKKLSQNKNQNFIEAKSNKYNGYCNNEKALELGKSASKGEMPIKTHAHAMNRNINELDFM